MNLEEEKIRLDERLKIARDLHDQFSGSIAALNINFSVLKKKLSNDFKENEQSYINLEKINNSLKKELSQFLLDLREETYEQTFEFISSLNNFLDKEELLKNHRIKSNINNKIEQCTSMVKKNLYRIIQELVNNIIKHANATEIEIQLAKNDEYFTLLLQDNGNKAFESSRINSFGLKGIQERVHLISGKLDTEKLKPGSKVTLTFPVDN